MQNLSVKQARKLTLLSQGLHRPKVFGNGIAGTLNVLEHVGYSQIDTISVVERAHHHALWSRNPSYQTDHLEQLVRQGSAFEYWSHAAAYLPMRDYRFSLPYKNAIAAGQRHWYERNQKVMNAVLKRIRTEGALQARDFDDEKRTKDRGWGGRKHSKIALEQLFMEGELMIAGRQGFRKIYDLTERVLPDGVDDRCPSEDEFAEYLVLTFLRCHGIGRPAEFAYLRKGYKPIVSRVCQLMLESGKLEKVIVSSGKQNSEFYALPSCLEKLSTPLSQSKVAILSPFDHSVIQRKRTLDLFDFEYLIECYVTSEKRKFGYFCLPLLWGQDFAGRMDCKIDRKTSVLNIVNLSIETMKVEPFMASLKKALQAFVRFNGGNSVKVQRVSTTQDGLKVRELKSLANQALAGSVDR